MKKARSTALAALLAASMLAACDKLRGLALQTGDEALEKLADELEQKATAAHKMRAATMSGGAAEPEARPAVAANTREGKR